MSDPVNDDINRHPDLRYWWNWEHKYPTYPIPPSPPPGPRPWFLTPPGASPDPWRKPAVPTLPIGPNSSIDSSEDAPGGHLSYHGQNGENHRHPINSLPTAVGAAPADRAGGLLGMLYALLDRVGQSP